MLREISIVPTISLQGIDPYELYISYYQGRFTSIAIPKIESAIRFTCDNGLINPAYDQTGRDNMFSFIDKSGHENVFVTTGNDHYKIYHLDGKKEYSGGRCECCAETYETGMGGIPIKTWYEYINGNNVVTFGTIRRLCDFRCALRYILDKPYTCNRFTKGKSPECYLKVLYHLQHPDGPELIPALDPAHLKCNGGTLTIDQWRSTRYTFTVTNDHYVMQPIKECYQRT